MRRLLLASAALALALATGCDMAGDAIPSTSPGKGGGASVIPSPGGQPRTADPSAGGGDGGEAEEGAITADDCETVTPEPLPEGQWITGTLTCGDTVIGHTGGVEQSLFDTKFYETHHCTPAVTKHDSGFERVYQIKVPAGDRTVYIEMDTPCADLDIAAFIWSGDSPPTAASMIGRCEMGARNGLKSEKIRLASQKATTWTVVVEGKEEDVGAYALSVTCQDGI